MNFVWIFLGIGAVGLVMLVGYAVWLWRKASDLFTEISMLGRRSEELVALLEQVKVPALDPGTSARAPKEVSIP